MKPAAVLVAAFQIRHRVLAAVDLALDTGALREMHRVLQHEGVRGAGIEPDVENVVDFFPAFLGALAEKARGGARLVPGVGALFLEGLDDADLDLGVLQDVDRAVRLLFDEYGNRNAPGALARDHPVGPRLDHAGDPVLALLGNPAGDFDGVQRAGTQSVAALRDVFIHRDEPLRRIAEDDRLFRTPGVRVLMLEATGRDQHSGLFERLDDRYVGVSLLALVVDDALAREAWRLFGEGAIFIDGVRDGRIDAACFQVSAVGGPDIKVFATVTRRGVHEACTSVSRYMFAGKERNGERVKRIEFR